MKTTRKLVKNIVQCIFGGIDKLFIKLHLIQPTAIVFVDGGICSQINRFMTGEYYREQGYNVLYDISWFEYSGMDANGVINRFWELTTMFPNIQLRCVSRCKSLIYSYLLPPPSVNFKYTDEYSITRNVYIGGYRSVKPECERRYYDKYFNLQTMSLKPELHLDHSHKFCGVHVRRGDLANVNIPVYGTVSEDYFFKAIGYVVEHYSDVRFLFFSDDMDWVRNKIIPKINVSYELIQGNKPYEDLGLLAQCDIIVGSQGSFGRTAALINPNATFICSTTAKKTIDSPRTIIIK